MEQKKGPPVYRNINLKLREKCKHHIPSRKEKLAVPGAVNET